MVDLKILHRYENWSVSEILYRLKMPDFRFFLMSFLEGLLVLAIKFGHSN